MKFLVTRTSLYDNINYPPCEGVELVKVPYIDIRISDDPAKIPFFANNPELWYATGTNHRVENGRIKRDLGEEDAWELELLTLEELKTFIHKYGRVIVSDHADNIHLKLEIYDSYRE